jgi:hypothetical protein
MRIERKQCTWDGQRLAIEASAAGLLPGRVPARIELAYAGAEPARLRYRGEHRAGGEVLG